MEVQFGNGEKGKIALKLKTFSRHFVCLGSSGSGKTVACKVICEEFVRHRIPVIAIDPQGDIASLIECEDPAVTVPKGIDISMIRDYQKNAEVVIWTPASSIGVPLSLNPIGVVRDLLKKRLGYEETLRAISLAADSIAALLNYDLSSDDGRLMAGVLNIALTYIHENDLAIDNFSALSEFLAHPPDVFVERVQSIASPKELSSLARKLSLLTVGVKKLMFELGKPLDIEQLLGIGEESGRTRLSVIYLNTLASQEEKEFFVAQLAGSLYQWMLDNPSEELQALFYIDEVAPFLPPVKKPACKDVLKLLFKQARKYGIGCLIASQNPADIDYTALAQCSTWCLGRMLTRQDVKKVEQMLKSLAPMDCESIVNRLPSLSPGCFVLFAPDEFQRVVDVKVRWLITRHKTLDEEQIKSLVPAELRERYLAGAPPPKPVSRPADAQTEDAGQLDLEHRILQFLEKEPACLTSAEVAERMGINPATARKYLSQLGEQVLRHRQGKSFLFWHSKYRFLPQYGLTGCVEVANLQILEPEAVRLAEKKLERKLIFFERETIERTGLQYLPLWQVHFTEALEKSFLFFKSMTYRQDNIYFHATSGKICIYDRLCGFKFVHTPMDNPSALVDLDDVCTFTSVVPGELAVDWNFWDRVIPEKELGDLIARKFQIGVHRIAMSFLPVWKFEIADLDQKRRRTLYLDGVTGMPVDSPFPADESA